MSLHIFKARTGVQQFLAKNLVLLDMPGAHFFYFPGHDEVPKKYAFQLYLPDFFVFACLNQFLRKKSGAKIITNVALR